MENNELHMPPPPPPPPPQSVAIQAPSQEMYNYAADLLMNQKRNVDEVRNELMQRGLDVQSASNIISELQVAITKQKKTRAKNDMMYGGGIFIVGSVITIASYAAASSSGGTYVMTWGAIIFGAIQFFRGLFNFMK